MTKVIR